MGRTVGIVVLFLLFVGLAVGETWGSDRGFVATWGAFLVSAPPGIVLAGASRLLDVRLSQHVRHSPVVDRAVGIAAALGAGSVPFVAGYLSQDFLMALLGGFLGYIVGVGFFYRTTVNEAVAERDGPFL